ncbi:MAG: ASKHA domain-containing protein [Lachnospiraceae bacterium]|nr:ASKHA domain-containing protein [Lachnospiraceae bacterium]
MSKQYTMKKNGTLLENLRSQGDYIQADCNGRGSCGKCRVRFVKNAPLPALLERKLFSPEELRAGWRLSCLIKVAAKEKLELELPAIKVEPDAVMSLQYFQKKDTISEKKVLAIDLGTTTIAMELFEADGALLDTWSHVNPQRSYGADVLSRISAAMEGNAVQLQTLVTDCLLTGIHAIHGEDAEIIVTGNTTMLHLLAGLPVEGLGKSPFEPYSLECMDYHLLEDIKVTCLPGISAFVGADILAGLYAVDFGRNPKKYDLFLDLGTNGEMALGNREHFYCTATAAGPAFEGGVTAGIFGADILALLAELHQNGKIDATGLLADPWFDTGVQLEVREQRFTLKQEHIRQLQMAKAAIAAGIHVLLQKMKIIDLESIEHVYLAGGFGYYLNTAAAVQIGLLPAELLEKCRAAGNTALTGAARYGFEYAMDSEEKTNMDAVGNMDTKIDMEKLRQAAEPINLAEEESFQKRYLELLNLEPYTENCI